MSKPKSSKMRTLLTLRVLLKYSGADHTINTKKLNEHLRPYGLECTPRVLRETVRLLRDMGFNVQSCEKQDSQGVWLEDRILADETLNQLIFAVTTNPHLSKAQAADVLQALEPLVPVYREHLLQNRIEAISEAKPVESICQIHAVIHEAIVSGRWVHCTIKYSKYNDEAQSMEWYHERDTLFTPRCIYQHTNNLYMIGFNNTCRRMDAVNFADIVTVSLAAEHKGSKADIIDRAFEIGTAQARLPSKYLQKIYEGPAVFYCRSKYVDELYNRFGSPDGPVTKDSDCRITYAISDAVVTSETLFWLSSIPNFGIQITGPESLVEAVADYYQSLPGKLIKNGTAHKNTGTA